MISRGRRDLAAFATAVAAEAERRQASGSSPCPEDMSDPQRDQSSRARAKDSARGGIRRELPETGAEVESGAAKTENADRLAAALAALSPTEKQRLVAHDRAIATNAAAMPPGTFARWLGRLLRRLADRPEDDGLSAAERAKAAAAWAMFRRPDGTWGVTGSFDDERGAAMDAAVTARAREIANRRPEGERAITANDRAVAVYELLCGTTLDNGSGDETAAGPNLAVGVIVDAGTLVHGSHGGSVAETWDGHPIDPLAAQRRACDADWYVMVYDALGKPSRVGWTRRHATRLQRLQLRGLYPVCPLDQATPFARCEIHHVNVAFELGGETELHNLVPISTTWHHRIHDGGWTLTMDPDRTLHLRRPDGTHDRTIAAPAPITRHGP